MKQFKLTVIATATLAMGLGVAGSAQAGAYAYSQNSLLDGFFISNNTANVFGRPVNTSADSATLTGFAGTGFSDVGVGLRDPDPANLGTAAGTANNAWTALGFGAGTFSRGDAAITQEQSGVGAGQGIQAASVAEANIDLTGSAESRGNNSSGTFFSVFTVTDPGTATFSFLFDPILNVALSDDASGSLAQAILTASLTITDNATGETVVSWVPNGTGSVGGSIGGTVAAGEDPYSLNKTLSQFLPGSQLIDDPLGFFRMTTGVLPIGTYNVTAEQSSRVSLVSDVAQVPEPATLALLGLGMVGMGFASRRRKQA